MSTKLHKQFGDVKIDLQYRIENTMKDTPPPITPVEMSEADIELCERAAKRIGYSQTAYTSTSGLWGLFCLPDHAGHREGCFIKTKQFGIMFVSDLEDLQLHDLAKEAKARKPLSGDIRK